MNFVAQPATRLFRIAYLLDSFPSLSETFVLNQITGLIARGHEVDIYANRPDPSIATPEDVQRYDLLERTHYRPNRPGNPVIRALKGVRLIAAGVGRAP